MKEESSLSDTLLILPNFSSTHSVGLLPHLPTSPPLPYLHIPHPCSSCGLVVSFVSQIPWSVLSPHRVQPNSMVDAAGHPFPGHLFFTWLLGHPFLLLLLPSHWLLFLSFFCWVLVLLTASNPWSISGSDFRPLPFTICLIPWWCLLTPMVLALPEPQTRTPSSLLHSSRQPFNK